MILKVFTSKFKDNRALLPLLLLALVLRLYKINVAFPFDFDQEVPAYAAYNFFINHKLSLIGQELSFQGFFLGPLHNWIEFIPYGFCNLMPDCTPYFYMLISLITIATLFFVVKNLFDKKTAIIASFFYVVSYGAITTERNVSSNYFIFLSSIGLLFCLYKYFQKKDVFLIIGTFFAGVAIVNFNPVFIFSAFAYFITALSRKQKKPGIFIISAIALSINYFPLVIFNWRHQHLLFESIKDFANQNTNAFPIIEKVIFLPRNIIIPFYSDYIFHSASFIFTLLIVALLLIGIKKLSKYENKFFLYLPIVITTTFAGFLFYKAHIPDYYFQQTLLSLIVIIAIALRGTIFLPLVCLTVLIMNMITFINIRTDNNYQIKKKVIDHILADTKDEDFNVYFNLPQGFNYGLAYLIKARGRTIQDGANNLYILEYALSDSSKYINTFKDKKITSEVIGAFQVVSVK